MSQSIPVESRPPVNWGATLVFLLTFLGAITLVPYWGLTHGFSVGAWVFFILFTGANGMAITGGYHRLWAHKTYDAHWSVRLLYMIFGTMALQNSVHRRAPVVFGARARYRRQRANTSAPASALASTRSASMRFQRFSTAVTAISRPATARSTRSTISRA